MWQEQINLGGSVDHLTFADLFARLTYRTSGCVVCKLNVSSMMGYEDGNKQLFTGLENVSMMLHLEGESSGKAPILYMTTLLIKRFCKFVQHS